MLRHESIQTVKYPCAQRAYCCNITPYEKSSMGREKLSVIIRYTWSHFSGFKKDSIDRRSKRWFYLDFLKKFFFRLFETSVQWCKSNGVVFFQGYDVSKALYKIWSKDLSEQFSLMCNASEIECQSGNFSSACMFGVRLIMIMKKVCFNQKSLLLFPKVFFVKMLLSLSILFFFFCVVQIFLVGASWSETRLL